MKFQPLNPNFKEVIKQKLKGQHFMHLIGFDITRIDCGIIEGEMLLEQVVLLGAQVCREIITNLGDNGYFIKMHPRL